MFVALFGWLLKSLSGGMLTSITNVLTNDTTVKGIITVEAIRAEIASRQASRDIILAEQGHFWTRMIRPAFAYPLAIYYAAIIFDSMPLLGHTVGSWRVATLPDPMMAWSGWIVAAMFVTSTAENMTRGVVYALVQWWKGKA
jgi:hypothetical protein